MSFPFDSPHITEAEFQTALTVASAAVEALQGAYRAGLPGFRFKPFALNANRLVCERLMELGIGDGNPHPLTERDISRMLNRAGYERRTRWAAGGLQSLYARKAKNISDHGNDLPLAHVQETKQP